MMITRRQIVAGGLAGISGAAFAKVLGIAPAARAAEGEAFEVVRSEAEWRQALTPAQFNVLREHGTERAGSSPLDKEYRKGTYHCAGCDLPLFSSETKFDSGTGWPSFWAPIEGAIGTSVDKSFVLHSDRGALSALRRPYRPRVRGRPATDGAALLHERRRPDLRSGVTGGERR